MKKRGRQCFVGLFLWWIQKELLENAQEKKELRDKIAKENQTKEKIAVEGAGEQGQHSRRKEKNDDKCFALNYKAGYLFHAVTSEQCV